METIYKYLNLPNFTPVFDLSLGEVRYDNIVHIDAIPNELQPNGEYLCPTRYIRYGVDDRYNEYVVELVPELNGQIKDIGYQKVFNEKNWPSGAKLFQHTDGIGRGKYCLHYILDTGGDEVATTWYQEQNNPLIRLPRKATDKLISMDRLTKIEEVIFSKGRWALFKTNILHSVQVIKTSRISFTIGFNNDLLFHTLVNKYGI